MISTLATSRLPDPQGPSRRSDSPWEIHAGILSLWLGIQLGCLALALLHVPVAAEYSLTERVAVETLLAGQIGAAAFLARDLFRTRATALIAVASVWPAILLAGGVEARPVQMSIAGAIAVSVWMALLWAWQQGLRSGTARAIAASLAALFAVGGTLLDYLAKEFGNGEVTAAGGGIPIFLSWSIARGESASAVNITMYLSILAAGLLLYPLRKRRNRLAD